MDRMELRSAIMKELWDLGVSGSYKGYRFCVHCVETAVLKRGDTARVFEGAARKFGDKPGNVYRNIQTLSEVIWAGRAQRLREVARNDALCSRPSARELIDILCVNILKNQVAHSLSNRLR